MISFAYLMGIGTLIRVKINNNGMEKLSMTQKYLLVVLATFANSEGECWPSQGLLAEILGVKQATICTNLKVLEKAKFIESCHRKTKKGGNTSKLYRMLFQPFVFKKISEQHFDCFGNRIDDPRMTDTSWAEGFE